MHLICIICQFIQLLIFELRESKDRKDLSHELEPRSILK